MFHVTSNQIQTRNANSMMLLPRQTSCCYRQGIAPEIIFRQCNGRASGKYCRRLPKAPQAAKKSAQQNFIAIDRNPRSTAVVHSIQPSEAESRASENEPSTSLVGEDAAAFDSNTQSTAKWTFFTVELGVVLAILYAVWIAPGLGIADDLLQQLQSLSSNSEVVMVSIFALFAVVHSGLAYLRPWGEELIGARAFRVIFAGISLPLAVLAVVYFINHRYDGAALWYLRRQPFIHELVWILNFVSFFFLYPSTFNLLEVAAVDKPKLHLWETGVMRITRHPQAFGQALWCAAHMLWIGSSFMLTTSGALMAHHLFSTWHGDFRLRRKYGEKFDEVKQRTSILPFAAILDGRQKLPKDYYKEFLRLPYLTLTFVTLGAYYAHPLMQQASAWLGW